MSSGAQLVLNVKLEEKTGTRGARVQYVVNGSTPTLFGRKREDLRVYADKHGLKGATLAVIELQRVSGVHFKIWCDGVTFYCQDLESTNGTFVLVPTVDGEEEVFLGKKAQPSAPCALQPLYSLLLAGEIRAVVESITLPPLVVSAAAALGTLTPLGAGGAAHQTDATVVCAPLEQDLVLHVVDGPGVGTFFVLKPGSRYLFGRKRRRRVPGVDWSGPAPAHKVGIKHFELELPESVADRSALHHRHVEIAFLKERERKSSPLCKFKVTARAPAAFIVRGPKELVDFETATWSPFEAGKSLLFAYDSFVRCGPVVFMVTNNLAAPRRLAAPRIKARSPNAIALTWPVPKSETSLHGYQIWASAVKPELNAAPLSLVVSLTNSHVVPELKPSTQYWFQVRAMNGAGPGPWSEIVSFATASSWSSSSSASSSDSSSGEPPGADALGPSGARPSSAAAKPGATTTVGASAAPGVASGATTATPATVAAVLGPMVQIDPAALTFVKSRFLGQGAQGRVYLVIETTTGAQYAVKEIDVDPSSADGAAEIKANVLMMRQLQDCEHPHIVRYKGVEVLPSMVRVFQEYCASGSLRKSLDDLSEAKGFPESLAALYTDQVLSGLAYLHSRNVLHRDIKAGNVLLHSAGDTTLLKISDFGLADCFAGSDDLRQATAKNLRGTPFFMAPEVIHGNAPEYKCDIWSVGCTVYEMITGQPPLVHLGAFRAVFFVGKLMREGHKIPQQYAPSAELADFLQCCFYFDPSVRWSAEQLRQHRWIVRYRDGPAAAAAALSSASFANPPPHAGATNANGSSAAVAPASAASAAPAAPVAACNPAAPVAPIAATMSALLADVGLGGAATVGPGAPAAGAAPDAAAAAPTVAPTVVRAQNVRAAPPSIVVPAPAPALSSGSAASGPLTPTAAAVHALASVSIDVTSLASVRQLGLAGGALAIVGTAREGHTLVLAFPPADVAAKYLSTLTKMQSLRDFVLHPNIARCVARASWGDRQGVAWRADETWLERATTASTADTQRLARDVASALAFLHSRRITHGALSAAAIVSVPESARYAIGYYGTNYLPCPEPMHEFLATTLGASVPTPPEVAAGQKPGSDTAEDVFAFGTLFAGVLPDSLRAACCADSPLARPPMIDVRRTIDALWQ